MEFKQLCGENISRLGMGNMRLPTTDGKIDYPKAQEIIDYLMAQGVNYYDTAYMYHGGESEKFIGQALKKYPRDSYFLASKMPHSELEKGRSPQEIFEEQLSRCGVDHFDFYLLHNVSNNTYETFLDENIGTIPYLLEQKKNGRIRHLGMSSHATPDILKKFLELQHQNMEFVQIQLNYLDWEMQDAKTQYEHISSYGLPVWVMEPCRGGRLAKLSPEADAILKEAAPDASVASWAFRWVKDLPNVGVVLSGMTDMPQAEDNVKTFSNPECLTEDQQATLQKALQLFRSQVNVPCTACHYCDGCPMGIDIPAVLALYNKFQLNPSPFIRMELEKLTAGPADCIGCGACKPKCPQNIEIPEAMSKFAEALAQLPPPPKP